MPQEHDHGHEGSHLSEVELRVRALESVLRQKGFIDPAAIDLLIETYEKKIGPRNGARVVAKAWVDQEFKRRLLAQTAQHGRVYAVLLLSVARARASACLVQIRTLPLARRNGLPRRASRLRRRTSCRHGNSRVGLDGRDAVPRPSHASIRHRGLERGATRFYRDAGLHDRHWPAAVTRWDGTMNGAHDMGGVHGFGPVVPEADEPTFHAEWEGRVFGLALTAGRAGQWNIDMGRFARENRPPADYLAKSYYEIWLAGLEAMLAERGLVSADEIEAGRPLGERRKFIRRRTHGCRGTCEAAPA